MLVLTRKVGEKIVIGDGVVISIEGIRPGRVQLGIAATQDVPIRRSEIMFSEDPQMPSQLAALDADR